MVILKKKGVYKGRPYRFILFSKSRPRRALGYHRLREGALRQERAIFARRRR